MERDRAKKAKASAKRERRQGGGSETTEIEEAEPVAPEPSSLSEAEVIDRLKVLHDRFEDGAVSFDDFEEQKAALLARLPVD